MITTGTAATVPADAADTVPADALLWKVAEVGGFAVTLVKEGDRKFAVYTTTPYGGTRRNGFVSAGMALGYFYDQAAAYRVA